MESARSHLKTFAVALRAALLDWSVSPHSTSVDAKAQRRHRARVRSDVHLVLTLLLGGLWLGANAISVVWGAPRGVALLVDPATQARPKLPLGLRRPLTPLVVIAGFAPARSPMLAFPAAALARSVAPAMGDVKLPARPLVAGVFALAFAVASTRRSVPSPFSYSQS